MKWLLLGALLAVSCGAPDERPGLVYDARFGSATSLDVYLPAADDGVRPFVLLIHGGSDVAGSKEDLAGAARRLARSGYGVASVNYRLVPGGEFPKNFQDCQCALAYVRAHAAELRADPARLAVMGYSAGGHLASLLGVAAGNEELAPDCEVAQGQKVARPAAVVVGSGPNDMRTLWESSHAVELYMGGPPDQLPHEYDLASPLVQVASGAPPYLIVSDDLLGDTFEANTRMRDALVAAGNDARLLKISGGWHVYAEHGDPGVVDFGTTTETPEGWIAIERFLARTVGTP
jgi:acetyl esterase/lipase